MKKQDFAKRKIGLLKRMVFIIIKTRYCYEKWLVFRDISIYICILRGSESQLKIQILRYNIANEKISNLPITNSKNNIMGNQNCIALRYIIIYHSTKFEVSI